MPQTLKLTNFDSSNIIDQTQLTASIAAGVSSLPVQNTSNFITNGFVLLGTKGSNETELLQAGTVTTSTAIPTTSNTKLPHNQYDPVYALFGDQLRIYRAQDAGLGQQPADTSFSLLDTVSIDADSALTTYNDSSGGGNYWYKYTHFNSFSSSETALSSSTAVRGNFTVNYCTIDEIRQRAGFAYAPYITDAMIDGARQYAQDEINGALDEFYETPFQPPINDYLRDLCVRLAVARLLTDQYGQTTAGTTADGEQKMKDAQADLQKLIMKERVLTNKEGQALDLPGATGGVEGWPNASTASTAGYEGGGRRFLG